jgi:hypothetical protein
VSSGGSSRADRRQQHVTRPAALSPPLLTMALSCQKRISRAGHESGIPPISRRPNGATSGFPSSAAHELDTRNRSLWPEAQWIG